MEYGLRTATAFLPFGASATLLIGVQSVLTMSLCFTALLAFWGALLFSKRDRELRLELAALLIILLCIYATLITLIGPRLFSGDIMVFSLDRNVGGYRLRHDIPSALSPLMPTKGNISQLAYFLISCAVFVMVLSLCRRKGPELIHKALIGAGIVNIVLAGLDVIGGDAILSMFQTASYAYLTDVQVMGRERLTAGFPEASSFGGFSVIIAGYFLRHYLSTRNNRMGLLAAGNFALGALSVSSTFIVSSVVVFAFLSLQFLRNIARGQGISSHSKQFVFLFMLMSFIVVLLMALSPLGAAFYNFFDYLIFGKAQSLSGYERGQWAMRGLSIGMESYGLGTGLGSTRSSGVFSVWISNLGVFGTLIYLYLYKVLLFPKKPSFEKQSHKYLFNAARIGLVANLASAITSATIADPGLVFALLAALSVASRKPVIMTYGKKGLSNPQSIGEANDLPQRY